MHFFVKIPNSFDCVWSVHKILITHWLSLPRFAFLSQWLRGFSRIECINHQIPTSSKKTLLTFLCALKHWRLEASHMFMNVCFRSKMCKQATQFNFSPPFSIQKWFCFDQPPNSRKPGHPSDFHLIADRSAKYFLYEVQFIFPFPSID